MLKEDAGFSLIFGDVSEDIRALAHARKAKSPVVVAKLDRLSRDGHFISGLMPQQVPFIVADVRRANTDKLARLNTLDPPPGVLIDRRAASAIAAGADRHGWWP